MEVAPMLDLAEAVRLLREGKVLMEEMTEEAVKLRKERDEAREAARWVFDGGYSMSEAMRSDAVAQWPWLEDE